MVSHKVRYWAHCYSSYKTITDKTVPILFADDTSLLDTSSNYNDFCLNLNTAFHCINEWFKANQLSINFNKTHHIQFTASKKIL
jgi:hypothetical protein